MRLMLIGLIFALVIPVSAQDGHPPLTDEYRFADLSFSIPADWVVLSAGGIYYIQNFDSEQAQLELRNLQSGQVQIVITVYPTENPFIQGVNLEDYIIGYHTGAIVEQLSDAAPATFTSQFIGLFEIDGWKVLKTETSVNDFLLMTQESKRIFAVMTLSYPGEISVWYDTAQAIGDSLQVED